jgi:hypothetical protein
MHRRGLGLALIAALLAPSLAMPARAQSPQRVWRGEIRCAPIPGVATVALRQPIELVVTGNQARYSRPVRRADTAVATPYSEDGAGIVAPDGSVVLTAEVTARSYAYTARYQGRLPPGGGHTRLVGAQTWTAGTTEPGFQRRCAIDLDG